MPYKVWLNPEHVYYDTETITYQTDKLTLVQARDLVANSIKVLGKDVEENIMRSLGGISAITYMSVNDDIDVPNVKLASIDYYE